MDSPNSFADVTLALHVTHFLRVSILIPSLQNQGDGRKEQPLAVGDTWLAPDADRRCRLLSWVCGRARDDDDAFLKVVHFAVAV